MRPAPEGLPPANGIPAGYGRSCTNCSRAKCRCIIHPGRTICERCSRLGKECHQIEALRKRVTKRSATSRTAQLEEKIEDLVSMLRANQNANAHRNSQSSNTTGPSGSSSFTSRLDSLAAAATADPPSSRNPHDPIPGRRSCQLDDGMPERALRETDGLPEPTAEEAEQYLVMFRSWLHEFPCIHIPDDLSAVDLRQDRPFLWLCIMNLVTYSAPQQAMLRDRIRGELAEKMVIENLRTMDILQGLLVSLVWATRNTGPEKKPFLILFSQLAQSIAFDMGLTRSPLEEQQSSMYFKVWNTRIQPAIKMRTMEERRIIITLWFIISSISTFIGRIEILAWTSHMEECLEVLEREKEYGSDEVLTTLVRIQLVGEEAHKLRRQESAQSHAPSYVFKLGLAKRLDDIQKQMSSSCALHFTTQAVLHSTRCLVHFIGLFTDQVIPEPSRIGSMYACVASAKRYYDIIFAAPSKTFMEAPFATWVSMSHTQIVLYRLTTSDEPAWDKEILRTDADLLVIMDKVVDMLNRVEREYTMRTSDPDGGLYAAGAKIMRKLRTSWEPALLPHLRDALPTPNSQLMTGSRNSAMDETLIAPDATMDMADLTWMSDIFGPWEQVGNGT